MLEPNPSAFVGGGARPSIPSHESRFSLSALSKMSSYHLAYNCTLLLCALVCVWVGVVCVYLNRKKVTHLRITTCSRIKVSERREGWTGPLGAAFMAAHQHKMAQHLLIMDCYGILCL